MGSQKQFGKNIKIARSKIGLTQKQIAKKAKISTNYYARVERGEVNPSIDVFEDIVKALKVKSSKIINF
ncbi:MAG: helix-turn-helix transcriptional regulator [Patescibacteria group bacterium]